MSNKRKQKLFIYYLVLICCIFMIHIASSIKFQTNGKTNYYNGIHFEKDIETSDYLVNTSILIDDSNPNFNWSKTAAENAWCSGSGSWVDPYIIQDIRSNDTIGVQHSNVHFKIMNCVFEGYFAGIGLGDVENGIIVDNQFFNGDMGLSSCNLTIISDNFFNDSGGIKIWNSRDLVIMSNVLNYPNYGIDAYNCNGTIISSNEIVSCRNTCIEFDSININNQIINNLIDGSYGYLDYGIDFEGNDNTFSNNIISNHETGFFLQGDNNDVINNTIINNEETGIGSWSNLGNNYINNTITNNGGWGVSVTSNDRFLQNNVSYNYIGFRCFRESNVLLKENNISNNRNYGIKLIQCDNFNITDNLLYGCGVNVVDSDWDDLELLSHNLSSNLINDRNLYIYYNQTHLRINNFTDAGQIILWYCNDSIIQDQDLSYASIGVTSLYGQNLSIIDSDLSNNNVAGVYIDEGMEFNITGNLLSFSDIGIIAHDLGNSSITNNTANECTGGMSLGIRYCVVSHNTMSNNLGSGLYLNGYTNNISYNIANYNDEGFRLEGSNNNNFYENEANYNSHGLFLTNSYNNTITRNTFLENTFGCIYGEEGNNVYDNICFSYTDLFFTRISVWMFFGLVTAGSTIGLIISIIKVIKKRKRKLKLERT